MMTLTDIITPLSWPNSVSSVSSGFDEQGNILPKRNLSLSKDITPVGGMFAFVYSPCEVEPKVFTIDQSDVLSVAVSLFTETQTLNDLEANVLEDSFMHTLKSEPTLKGRR